MLTILHRAPDGAEAIFSAEKLQRTNPRGEQCVPAMGSFVAHGVTISGLPDHIYEFEIMGPFGAVFVMNDKGKTVASYFAEPHPGRQSDLVQAA